MDINLDPKPISNYLLSKYTTKDLLKICEKKGLSKSGNKHAIIERLCVNVPESELFCQKPVQMFDWYETLFLVTLLDGPKKRSLVVTDAVFIGFLDKIDVDQDYHKQLCLDVFKWGKKNLVKRGLVQYNQEIKTYSISPTVMSYLSKFKVDIDEVVESFNKSPLRRFYDRKHRLRNIAFHIDKSFSIIGPEREVVRYSEKKPAIVSPDEETDVIRVLAFSDWRVQPINDIFLFIQKNEPVDFIIYAGDDLGRFRGYDSNYFTELSKLVSYHKILAVLGNDDFYTTSKKVLEADGVNDLYDHSLIFKNFAFVGLESSTSGPAIFRHEEIDFKAHLETQCKFAEGKRLIIVSHTPPFGILDRGIRFATEDERTHHIGSTILKNLIETQKVDLIVCGHCHSQGGMIENLGDTTIVNVSSHDNPGAKGNFAIIEISKHGIVTVEWHDTTEVRNLDSPLRIHGIGPVYCDALVNCDINTIGKLAEADDLAQLSITTGVPEILLTKFQLKARSMIKNETYQTAPFNLPLSKSIYFDIETDIKCEKVWLIGIEIDGKFTQLYADNWEQEREILEKFIEILMQNTERALVSYSGTNFDHRVTFGALTRHNLHTDLFESFVHIDLCTLLNRCFIFPNQSFALKELGSFLEYPFKYPELDGLQVALSYHAHVEDGKPLDPKVFEYNEDDVRVIPYMIEKAFSTQKYVTKYY